MSRPIPLILASAFLPLWTLAQGAVLSETFEGWPPPGWSTPPSSCMERWGTSPSHGLNNYTGGEGAAAAAFPSCAGLLDLVSPPFDLPSSAREAHLVLLEDRFLKEGFTGEGEIALSEDGGVTYPHRLAGFGAEGSRGPLRTTLDLTPWLGKSNLRLRFRFDASGSAFGWWEVDEVRVEALPCASPQPILSGDPSACAPGPLLVAPEGYASYRWFFDGIPLEGVSGNELLAGRTGRYAVEVSTGEGCRGLSSEWAVSVEDPPRAPSISGPVEGCAGTPVVLEAVGGSYASLQWYQDGFPFPGAHGSTLTVLESGNYAVKAENGTGCASFSPVHRVEVRRPSEPALLPQEGEVVLEAQEGLSGYAWRKDGQPLPGRADRRYIPEETGTYAYEGTFPSGCSALSPEVAVSLPSRPSLTAAPLPCPSGARLEALGASAFTWEVDGRPLPGASGSELTTTLPGTYTVVAEDGGGPPRRSDPVTVEILPCTAREVSGVEAFYPFEVQKTTAKDGTPAFRLTFQKAPGAVSYALFWGTLGDFTSHGEPGHGLCALAASDDGSGRLEVLLEALPDDAYFLLAADLGGGSFTLAGRDSAGNPLPPGVCTP